MVKKTCKDCIGYKYCSDYEKYDEAYINTLSDTEDVSTLCSLFVNTEDVVPRSEVEHWKEEANHYQNLWCQTCNDLEQAKQEVAKQIFEEIEAEYGKRSGADRGDDLTYGEVQDFFAELKKKYIGEVTENE